MFLLFVGWITVLTSKKSLLLETAVRLSHQFSWKLHVFVPGGLPTLVYVFFF